MLIDFEKRFVGIVQLLKWMILLVIVLLMVMGGSLYFLVHPMKSSPTYQSDITGSQLPNTPEQLIQYGKELIIHTAGYLGPSGKVAQISNGMNCQNCHLEAGMKDFGNNFKAVATTYPKVRGRSGKLESIEMRINDCFKRSLNGDTLEWGSTEMKALVAYINSVGRSAEEIHPGIFPIEFLARPASAEKGMLAYEKHCIVCHGEDGQGLKLQGSPEYVNPPLWGNNSYNTAAGLYRLSRFAGYIKINMPFGTTVESPILTDEEAWDIAAYVNTRERPKKIFNNDWPDISKKPIDHPFGPYADQFSEQQHKFGPYPSMLQKSNR